MTDASAVVPPTPEITYIPAPATAVLALGGLVPLRRRRSAHEKGRRPTDAAPACFEK